MKIIGTRLIMETPRKALSIFLRPQDSGYRRCCLLTSKGVKCTELIFL